MIVCRFAWRVGLRPSPGLSRVLLVAVTTAELVDLTCCVHDFLLTGVEGVAGSADFDAEVLADCGTRLEGVTTTASDRDFTVVRVDLRFHNGLSDSVSVERGGILPSGSVQCKPLLPRSVGAIFRTRFGSSQVQCGARRLTP